MARQFNWELANQRDRTAEQARHDRRAQAKKDRPKPPTPRQLDYLRYLAARAGEPFTAPRTFLEASGAIDRLKAARRKP